MIERIFSWLAIGSNLWLAITSLESYSRKIKQKNFKWFILIENTKIYDSYLLIKKFFIHAHLVVNLIDALLNSETSLFHENKSRRGQPAGHAGTPRCPQLDARKQRKLMWSF